MKIQNVEIAIYETQYPQLFVSIITDEGIQGTGEAWWGLSVKPVESAIRDTLAPLLIGEDPHRIEYLWNKMFKYAYRYGTEGVIMCGLSGIDLALWDLKGKQLGVPVANLLGGLVRDSIKTYASLPPLRQETLLRDQVERAVTAGFAGVKLHEVKTELVAVAREAAPKGYPIMLDVNGHWTPKEAEKHANDLEKFDLVWLEEPIWPMQDHNAMARVRQRVRLPFAAGENEYTLTAFDSLMVSGAVDYAQPEITKIGGLSMARKISTIADLHNVPICPHGFRVGPALYANIHWALTQINMEWLEIPLLPESYPLFPGICIPNIIKGEIYLPEGYGLGLPPEFTV